MADLVSYGHPERDIEQALITLKKGTQLIKYSRKGKPKFRAFRVSLDETSLIWISHGDERNLRLSSVLRIIPGQRTAVFRRYLRPEKDYLSFSLIYNNGERSLDLICKDKVEAEVWFGGLKTLIGKNRNRRATSDISDVHGGDFVQNGSPFGASLDDTSSIARGRVPVDSGSRDSPLTLASSDVVSDNANMQLRTSTGDGFRISVSSTPSCSSGGSGPEDIESLGDVYVWGEVWSDAVSDGSVSSIPTKVDVLTPKPLESNVVLDVHQIACGVRNVALVTRQGEVFTWGEESGGRLGHGIEKDFSHPRLIEFLAVINVDFVACGEYHTCAVSTSGDLFTWGDGTHNAGLLGHGTDVSHWIPKRVSGPLEGLQVLSIACGSWHSALATSNGKLFTFGDGAFGVLGHGDRESVSCPKEVQLLSGLKTLKVACGVWHTAAIVEVMGQPGANISSRKLFTWGDGDKYRLGHGNKDTYLLPTCVSCLIDYNFHQLACGHTMTVALTTSGHVFTMGSPENGQLGNPISDGKVPCLVQDKLVGEFVEEIACGAYHVAVLTSRSEVLTWGRGANGRLGHGDTEDRKSPTLVETLKDRHVKNIVCGSNFTSSICIHKWVSGADQSVCSGCRQAFGFTRKRHNCYHCGLVHCHACSSRKALKAALAPTPGKPHRVCDACYAKLKAAEAGNDSNINRKVAAPRRSIDTRERIDRGEVRSSRILLSPTTEPVRYLEVKSGKRGDHSDSPSIIRASQVPSLLQLKDIAFPSSLSALQNAWKPAMNPTPQLAMNPAPQIALHPTPQIALHPTPQPTSNSRPSSPYSRRPSPPRSASPGFSRGVVDTLKRSNDILHQELAKLHNQIRTLNQKCDVQDMEIQKLQKNAQDAASLAEAESSRCREAKDIVKSITEQLKEITEKLPPECQESETFRMMSAHAEAFLNTNETSEDSSSLPTGSEPHQQIAHDENPMVHESSNKMEDHDNSTGATDMSHCSGNVPYDSRPSVSTTNGAASHQSSGKDSKSTNATTRRSEGEKEIIEQFEPGVYVTFVQRRNGGRNFKRVRFSKRKFAEQQAEEWWNRNKERVLKRYNTQIPNNAHVRSSSSIPATSEEHKEEGPPSHEIQASKEESSSEA
ncbi:disease resistance family protein [Tripterygium wilfordii]|uniref:Disease resistance family protein n=1 Tax=Tripterygium wilfordii TaxID=458696 RepID=A0A7J7E1I1_TRIWF|nr:PH, RCC1 and FYVE domains-containing protein 1-like [Tripterygium wilfordii]KAF5752393.1 disease resistance family protein [Tripterygium wilfordii]